MQKVGRSVGVRMRMFARAGLVCASGDRSQLITSVVLHVIMTLKEPWIVLYSPSFHREDGWHSVDRSGRRPLPSWLISLWFGSSKEKKIEISGCSQGL